jgi:hypothetical protein
VSRTIPILPIPIDAAQSRPGTDAPQRVAKVRRDYNSWVASETMEDYALRYTPQRFRKWSTFRVANTAFGAASFLILEAVGATLLVQYGFLNAFWAILATGLIKNSFFLRACLPQNPCLSTSKPVPVYLKTRACLPQNPCLSTSKPVPISAVVLLWSGACAGCGSVSCRWSQDHR